MHTMLLVETFAKNLYLTLDSNYSSPHGMCVFDSICILHLLVL